MTRLPNLDRARAAKTKAVKLYANRHEVNGIGLIRLGDKYAIQINLANEPNDVGTYKTSIDGVSVVLATVGKILKQGRKLMRKND